MQTEHVMSENEAQEMLCNADCIETYFDDRAMLDNESVILTVNKMRFHADRKEVYTFQIAAEESDKLHCLIVAEHLKDVARIFFEHERELDAMQSMTLN